MKHLSLIRYVLLGISALVILVWIFFMPNDAVDTMLYWNYILLALSLLLIIVLPLVNMVKNPKGALRSLTGLAAIVVLCVIGYALGSSAPVVNSGGGFFENPVVNKLTDMGLYLAYAALGVTLLVAIFGEIRNSLK